VSSASIVVTLSPKFQLVVPKEVRESLKLKPNEKLVALEKGGGILFFPLVPLKSLRGTLKGMTTEGFRDHSERF